jgi:hypothetical protein
MSEKYKDEMFEKMSQVIEEIGKDDESYDNYKKSTDVLEALEGLLSYAIYSTSIDSTTVRDSCEESYMNIKRTALRMMAKEKAEESTAVKA